MEFPSIELHVGVQERPCRDHELDKAPSDGQAQGHPNCSVEYESHHVLCRIGPPPGMGCAAAALFGLVRFVLSGHFDRLQPF